jgi:hypothetical protein
MTLAAQKRRGAGAQAYGPGLGRIMASVEDMMNLRICCASALLRFCTIHG